MSNVNTQCAASQAALSRTQRHLSASAKCLNESELVTSIEHLKRPLCPHSNILEECSQCDSDFQQEVDSTMLDQIPDDVVVSFPHTL